MQGENRTLSQGDRQTWQPSKLLRPISAQEARYSRGFLSASPNHWFAQIAEQWLPLFHSLSADVAFRGFEKTFSLPPNLRRKRFFAVDNEPALIAMDDDSVETIAREIVPGCQGTSADIVVEYIERRLLATLQRCWLGKRPLQCHYLSQERSYDFDLSASVAIHLEVSGSPCTIWIGMGNAILERLDAEARGKVVSRERGRGLSSFAPDRIHILSVELVELAVPPSVLIDYMRGGTLIDLEIPASDKVYLRVDEALWAEGRLCHFNGAFAVEITATNIKPRMFPDATTRVRVEVAATELDADGVLEHAQVGAILLTDTEIAPRASLIISGENVADALVAVSEGRFALSVLPR